MASRRVGACALLFWILTTSVTAGAFELSHYAGGFMNVDDFFLPPTAAGRLIYAQYNVYYHTETFRDHDGHDLDSITVTGPSGTPRTIDLDLDVNLGYIVPALMWASQGTVLGGRYGGYIAVPVGNPSLQASLSTRVGRGRDLDQSAWGVGDMLVQPLWFMWTFGRLDLSAAYAFDAPTGKYSDGSPTNVGLGFWEQQFQSALRYNFDEDGTFSGVLGGTFEIPSEKKDVDITPGTHFTLNWGVRKNLLNDWVQLGVLGYDSWQTTEDHGSDAAPSDQRYHDEVHGAGVQLGIPKLGLAVKYLHEFEARDRFEGQMVTLLFGLPLEVIAEKLGL